MKTVITSPADADDLMAIVRENAAKVQRWLTDYPGDPKDLLRALNAPMHCSLGSRPFNFGEEKA